MKSLKQIITDLPEEQWNYYHRITAIQKPSSFDQSFHFLQSYFQAAKKSEIIGIETISENNPFAKVKHTVSIYFLGCWLAANLNLKNQINNPTLKRKFENDFLFVWFLSCLYHDIHFQIERPGEIRDYSALISADAEDRLENLLTRRIPVLIPPTLKKAIRPYYNYRQKYWNVIDHGIAAGIYLFNDLITLRKANAKKRSHLNFTKSVEKLYTEAAYAIAVHNIYLPKDNDIERYKKYGLDALIGHAPIHFSDAPFLFLLGLSDTLDPIKAYSCVNADAASELVLFQFETDKDAFHIKMTINEPLDFTIMANKKADIENWLKIVFTPDSETRSIVITIQKACL
ncbi:MAG: hypothetical protein M0Q90_13735 [Bacteroidales bacterium]|nr:hypothetical protein [Bacteroidales bacterium]